MYVPFAASFKEPLLACFDLNALFFYHMRVNLYEIKLSIKT